VSTVLDAPAIVPELGAGDRIHVVIPSGRVERLAVMLVERVDVLTYSNGGVTFEIHGQVNGRPAVKFAGPRDDFVLAR
jgi:hypothetical protein